MHLDSNDPHAVEMRQSIKDAVKKIGDKLSSGALLLAALETQGGLCVRTNSSDDEIKRTISDRIEGTALQCALTELEHMTLVDECVEAVKKCRNKAIILEVEEVD